tara:strand:- start:219 stop:422 length:204 start_codon:yes stop_codon:yes gene_type:complete
MKYNLLIVSSITLAWWINPIFQEKRDIQRCMSLYQKENLAEFEMHGRGSGTLLSNEVAFLEAYKVCH